VKDTTERQHSRIIKTFPLDGQTRPLMNTVRQSRTVAKPKQTNCLILFGTESKTAQLQNSHVTNEGSYRINRQAKLAKMEPNWTQESYTHPIYNNIALITLLVLHGHFTHDVLNDLQYL